MHSNYITSRDGGMPADPTTAGEYIAFGRTVAAATGAAAAAVSHALNLSLCVRMVCDTLVPLSVQYTIVYTQRLASCSTY